MNVRGLTRSMPPRWKRAYRRYLSPILRDEYYRDYRDRRAFFRKACAALAFNGIAGGYAEFGCCGGVTFDLAHRYFKKYGAEPHMWAFDSFQGLPSPSAPEDAHPLWTAGTMSMSRLEFQRACKQRGIPADCYTIIEGYFDRSLAAPESDGFSQDICLAYIDCDLYSSTKTVLQFLEKRLKHGVILGFDDYYCWSATQASGERKACAEFFANHPQWILVPFYRFGMGGMSFVVEARALGAATGAGY